MARSSADDAFLTTARARYKLGTDTRQKQTERELADLAFYEGGDAQWTTEMLESRKGMMGTTSGLPPVPARPHVTLNKMREPVRQVLNQERQNDVSIELVAADDFGALVPPNPANTDEKDLREGLIRRIQRESDAADARTWAFSRAVICGEGNYGVMVRFVQGKTWDKEIYIERYFNQSCVVRDPAHEQPDGSDADWVFTGSDKMPWDEYRLAHPRLANGRKNPLAGYVADDQWRALGEECPGWFATDDTDKSLRHVRVMNYYYTEREARTLCLLADGSNAWEDELPDDFDDTQIVDTREVIEKTIKWAKIDGKQVLEETDWEGPDMPVIKVLGEELHPHGEERRVEGMVRAARDAQMGFNIMASKWLETVGLSSIPPLSIIEGQVSGYEAWYQAATTRAIPYLPWRQKDLDGNEAKTAPTRPQSIASDLVTALAQSMQMYDEGIKATTMVPSVQLGHATDPHLKSGRAINSMIAQGSMGTSHYEDNKNRSMRYEGQVINNLLYPIYGKRPGRLVRIVTGEGDSQTIAVNAPPALGSQPLLSGPGAPLASPHPMPGMPGQPTPPPPPPPQAPGPPGMPMNAPPAGPMSPPAPPPQKRYQLTEHANFNVIVKLTRGSLLRRAEAADFYGELLGTNPEFMTWFGDLALKMRDDPGAKEAAERVEVMLAPPIQQMLAAKQTGQPAPNQQVQTLQNQLKQAEQFVQQAQQQLQSKTMEAQIKKQIADDDRAFEREKLRMQLAAKILEARIAAGKEHSLAAREDAEEALALQLTQQHEHAQAELDREHQAMQSATDRAHTAAQSEADRAHATQLAQTPRPMAPSPPSTPPPGGPPPPPMAPPT